MGVTAAVATVVGTAYSAVEQRRASRAQSRAQRRQQEAQERMADQRQLRENQQAIRRRRAQRAQIMARAEAGGVAGSSGELGAISSIGSQTASNIGFAGGQVAGQREMAREVGSLQRQAQTALGRAQIGQTVAGIGNQMMGPQGFAGVFEQAGAGGNMTGGQTTSMGPRYQQAFPRR